MWPKPWCGLFARCAGQQQARGLTEEDRFSERTRLLERTRHTSPNRPLAARRTDDWGEEGIARTPSGQGNRAYAVRPRESRVRRQANGVAHAHRQANRVARAPRAAETMLARREADAWSLGRMGADLCPAETRLAGRKNSVDVASGPPLKSSRG
jgi:hypothetical protein